MASETLPTQLDRTNQTLVKVVYYTSMCGEPDAEKLVGAARAQEYLAHKGEFAGGYTEITDQGKTMRLVLLAYVDTVVAEAKYFDSYLNRPVIRGYCGSGEVW